MFMSTHGRCFPHGSLCPPERKFAEAKRKETHLLAEVERFQAEVAERVEAMANMQAGIRSIGFFIGCVSHVPFSGSIQAAAI